MNIYRPGTCCWCFDDDGKVSPAEFVLISGQPGNRREEHLCRECNGMCNEQFENWLEGDAELANYGWTFARYEPEKVLWHRGQRVDIVRPSRPRVAGTVIHSYMSRHSYEWMVNVVWDGKKWPAIVPARFVEEHVSRRLA